MDDDEIEGWREMTLDEKKRLREILGYGLSAALPIAADDRDVELARLRTELAETDKLRLQTQQSRDTWQKNYYKLREEMRVISGISSDQDTPIESLSLVYKIASDALK